MLWWQLYPFIIVKRCHGQLAGTCSIQVSQDAGSKCHCKIQRCLLQVHAVLYKKLCLPHLHMRFCIDMSTRIGNQGAWPIKLLHIPSQVLQLARLSVSLFFYVSFPFAMHHRYLVACVLSFLLPASSVLADKSAQQYLSEGNQFLSTGKLNDALISFDAAIGKESSLDTARHYILTYIQ